jgi:hypothetical protein
MTKTYPHQEIDAQSCAAAKLVKNYLERDWRSAMGLPLVVFPFHRSGRMNHFAEVCVGVVLN